MLLLLPPYTGTTSRRSPAIQPGHALREVLVRQRFLADHVACLQVNLPYAGHAVHACSQRDTRSIELASAGTVATAHAQLLQQRVDTATRGANLHDQLLGLVLCIIAARTEDQCCRLHMAVDVGHPQSVRRSDGTRAHVLTAAVLEAAAHPLTPRRCPCTQNRRPSPSSRTACRTPTPA